MSLNIFRVGDWCTKYSYSFRAVEETESGCYNFSASEDDEEEQQGTTEA